MVTELGGDRISIPVLMAGVGVIGLGMAGLALSAPAIAQDDIREPTEQQAPADAVQDEAGESSTQPPVAQTDAFGNVIIVTARKREEMLQDIPVAVAALSGNSLDDVGIQRLDETTALIPNLRVSHAGTGPGVASLYIHGIGYNGTEKLEAPSVGVFIDDFYWGMGRPVARHVRYRADRRSTRAAVGAVRQKYFRRRDRGAPDQASGLHWRQGEGISGTYGKL